MMLLCERWIEEGGREKDLIIKSVLLGKNLERTYNSGEKFLKQQQKVTLLKVRSVNAHNNNEK